MGLAYNSIYSIDRYQELKTALFCGYNKPIPVRKGQRKNTAWYFYAGPFGLNASISNVQVRVWLMTTLAALLVCSAAFAQQPPPPPGAYDAAPYLGQIRNTYVYGDIWERPGLSARDRSMITVAVNQATYATNELRLHMGRALDNGITQAELTEIIAHTLWYSGFPTGVNAARVAAQVFEERGLSAIPPGASSRQPPVNPELEFPEAYSQTPYLRDLLNQVLYFLFERVRGQIAFL